MLTRDDLARFARRPAGGEAARNWDAYVGELVERGAELCDEAGIDEALELQHFFAQIAHESGGFTILWENMSYRAERIVEIFGNGRHSAGVSQAEAETLAGKPYDLAERVYGIGNPRKARELGNREPGDGFRYRGYGPMQITGRKDHERLLNGEVTPYAALRAAFREWTEKNCNDAARRDDIKTITKRINGGFNGLEDRRRWLAKAKKVWPVFPGASDAPPKSMLTSTTARTAEALATGGTFNTASEVSVAVAKVAERGEGFSLSAFLMALASSPSFWIGVFTIAGAAYIWLERRRKLVQFGI
jgi:predicted chitinase